MRRFLFITGILLPVIFLSGCDNGINLEEKSPVLEFQSSVNIKSEEMQVSANVKRHKDGMIQLDIITPEALKGLSFKHSKTENSISRDDLSYKTDDMVLPNSSVIVSIIEILDCMEDIKDEKPFYKDEKEMAFIGKTDSGKFELRSDRKTGFITELKIGEKTTVLFSKQENLTC